MNVHKENIQQLIKALWYLDQQHPAYMTFGSWESRIKEHASHLGNEHETILILSNLLNKINRNR